MRRGIILIFLVFTFGAGREGHAQRQPFTQYFLNLPAINPAFSGMEPFLDLKTSYKQRWSNFTDQNSSFFVSAYGVLGQPSPTIYRHNALRVSDPNIYGRMAQNKSVNRKHGIGGMIMARQVGAFKALSMSVNYAFHLPLTRQLSLSMGTKVAFQNHRLSYDNLTVRDEVNDLFFQELMKSSEGQDQRFVGDFGVTLYTDRFYLGVSSSYLISQPMRQEEILKIRPDKAFEMLIGTQLNLDQQFELYPGFRIRNSEYYGLTWEANVRIRYNKLIYAGAVYEQQVKAALLFGLTFAEKYNINYSYDYYLNDLREFSTGNHEFTLGLAVFNKYSREPRLW